MATIIIYDRYRFMVQATGNLIRQVINNFIQLGLNEAGPFKSISRRQDTQHNDTQHKELLCQHKLQLA